MRLKQVLIQSIFTLNKAKLDYLGVPKGRAIRITR